jgi:carbon monoxide dehydrogenase subunit G
MHTPRPPEEAFAYMSDFSTTEQWDPGVASAKRLGDGPVGEGTEFALVARFLGRENAITYKVVELEAPISVTLLGENASVVSLDRVTCEPSGTGTKITYDARLTLKGPLRIADPLLALVFKRVGDRALAGLRATIGEG